MNSDLAQASGHGNVALEPLCIFSLREGILLTYLKLGNLGVDCIVAGDEMCLEGEHHAHGELFHFFVVIDGA